jgi:hypothetical protein
VHPIFVDVWQDLEGAQAEAAMVEQARLRGAAVLADSDDLIERWIYVNAVASGIEKVYSGIEKALVRIVRDIDRHVPEGPDWHATLLRRLARSVPDGRPSVLSPETRRQLDRLRAFRHRERNSYVGDLQPDLVLGFAAGIGATLAAVVEDVARFQQALKA